MYRMVESGKDLWRSPGPTTLLRQSHIAAVGKNCVQVSSEPPQGWWLHNLLGQPWVLVFGHPQSEKVFAAVWRNLLCFSLWPLTLVLSLDTTKSLAPSSLYPPGICTIDPPWAFSSPGWTVPAFSAFPPIWGAPVPYQLYCPLLDSFQGFHVSY